MSEQCASTTPMRRLPRAVRDAMAASGASATCLPVQLDGSAWETVLFLQCAGSECKEDRRILRHLGGIVPVGVETDLLEHESAAVVMLRLEAHTRPDDPLTCEILLTPGAGGSHFDSLQLLASQPRLCWFFADQAFEVLHSQQHTLDDEQHAGFEELLRDALRHDSLVRLTRRYDAQAALAEVVSHYELRAGTLRPGHAARGGQPGGGLAN